MQQNFSRTYILTSVIFGEAFLLLVATIWIHIAHIDLLPLLMLKDASPVLIGAALGVAMSLSSLGMAKLARKFKRFKFLSGFDEIVSQRMQYIFKELNVLDIALIAFASGFCEEVLFRGVLQTQYGIVLASLVFGLVHYAGEKYLAYAVWSVVAGLVLGFLLQYSGGLWMPISMHVVNNLVSISMIRYRLGYTPDSSSDAD